MTISISRRFLAHIVRSITYFLWALDVISSTKPVYAFLFVVYFSLLFVIRSADLQNVFNGIFLPGLQNYPSEISYEKIYPLKYGVQSLPNVTAVSVGIYDRKTGKALFERLPNERLAPASTTKLMTALVALDIYGTEDIVKIPYFCTNIESTKAWLPAEEEFKAYELINVMLVGSVGDAACALATSKISYSDFVSKMNEKAISLGMKDTNFVNPIGLDGYKGVHYSTVHDLYLLSSASLKNDTVSNAVKKKDYVIKSLSSDFTFEAFNTNRLLWEIPGTFGIKTGTTVSAGEVLIFGWEDTGKQLISIVMGSKDRFADTKALLNWTVNNYVWK
jgi:D-alanyl-D-alanine carboxypeptidase (penicillin-binding protein 5/6)